MAPPRILNDLHLPEYRLHRCVHNADVAELRRLVQSPEGQGIINKKHATGTPLCFAVYHDRLDMVDVLLAAGANPLTRMACVEWTSPMILAIQLGNSRITHRLWMHVSPSIHADETRATLSCLYQAAFHGHATLIGHLLTWWDGWTDVVKERALMAAARRWHVHVVDVLLEKWDCPVRILAKALHAAIGLKQMMEEDERRGVKYRGVDFLDHELLITRLLEAGADPNTLDEGGPILFKAIEAIDLVGGLKALLESGLDPNMPNPDLGGQTALHLLSSPIQNRQEYQIHETGIRLLLKHGASVLQPDVGGNTPLHLAAHGTDVRIFQLYLSSVPKDQDWPNIQNHCGDTLLHWAAAGAKVDILEYLILCGLDVNTPGSNGWTPLQYALAPPLNAQYMTQGKTLYEAIRAAHLLLFHGADPMTSTTEGCTTLHCLALYEDEDDGGAAMQLTRHLIARGADTAARARLVSLEPKDSDDCMQAKNNCESVSGSGGPTRTEVGSCEPGLTPLHWAAYCGALGVAKGLLANGADPNSKSSNGTPMHIAKEIASLPSLRRVREKLVQLLTNEGGEEMMPSRPL